MRAAAAWAVLGIGLLAGSCTGGGGPPTDVTPSHAPPSDATPSVAVRAARTETDSVVTAGVTLHGTLELPASSCGARTPVALIVAGSGPTDRNGNSLALPGENNSLRMIAEGLAANCIASVRYDKRGIGRSMTPTLREDELRFTTYADDAAAWVTHLRDDARFDDIIVIGHSEGATLGTIAARDTRADGLVLIAGAGRPIGETLREQLRAQVPEAMYRQADSILVELEAGRTVATVPGNLLMLFRPSIQPYWISWLGIDPAAELARLDIPTLVIWGTTDVQAARADAERLAAADDDVGFVVIEGMNHVLKTVSGTPQEQEPSYSDPTLPLANGLIEAIVAYVREVE